MDISIPVIAINIMWILGVVILGIITCIGYEVYKIVKDFRRVSDRIELLTDIKGWFNLYKKFKKIKD